MKKEGMTTSIIDGIYRKKIAATHGRKLSIDNYGYYNVEGDDSIMVGYCLHYC